MPDRQRFENNPKGNDMSENLTKTELARLCRNTSDTGAHCNSVALKRLADALDPPKPKFKRGDFCCNAGGGCVRPCLNGTHFLDCEGNHAGIPLGDSVATKEQVLAWAIDQPDCAGRILWQMGRVIAGEKPE